MIDYYVKTGGDNAKDGLSWANAWATIDYAQANAVSGDGSSKTPAQITTEKNFAISNKGSLKWFYLDDDSGGGGSWHGWFNVIHIEAGTYNEVHAFIFNPPEWTRWEGAAFDTTHLFNTSYASNQTMSNDYIVINKCSIGTGSYAPNFSTENSDLAMIDCGIRGRWTGTPTQLYCDDCYFPCISGMGVIEFDYVTDSIFKNISPHGTANRANIDVHGDRNLFDNIAGFVPYGGLSGTAMKVTGNDNIVTGCSDISQFSTCGTTLLDIENISTGNLTVQRSTEGYRISSVGGLTDQPNQICYGDGYLWMTERRNNKCYRFNPNTAVGSKDWAAPYESQGIAWDGSHVWIATYWTDLCYKKDIDGNPISQFALVDLNPLTWVGSHLYTADANNFYKYDTLGNLIDTYPVTESSFAIAYDGTYIWGMHAGDSSVINKFSVTGTLLETVTTGVSKPDGTYKGIAADTVGNIWIIADCGGASSNIYLVLDGSQLCVDCDITKLTTKQSTQLTLDWNARDFYETSNGQWTTVTTAKSQLIFAEGLTDVTLTNRPLLITTNADVSALITSWSVAGYMDKTFKIDATGSRTLTFQLGDMAPATAYKVYAGAVRLPDEASDGSGVLTFSYTGSFSEIEFNLQGYVPVTGRSSPVKSAISPASYGWFCGGSSNVVDRIKLAYDTTNAIDRCDLSLSRNFISGFTNGTYGWFGGGYFGAAAYSDRVDRMTLATDTVNAIDRCNLTADRYGTAAFADSTYGWFGGGAGAVMYHTNRITLATDTDNAINRCNLTLARYSLTAFTDITYGWFGGGRTGPVHNNVDRMTLASDMDIALDRCDLAYARGGLSSFTDNTYGWFGGGESGGGAPYNYVDRIELADDTVNAVDKCDLTISRGDLAAFTDDTYGWFGGGSSNRVDRITLATDTVNAIDRCDLSVSRSGLAAFTGVL